MSPKTTKKTDKTGSFALIEILGDRAVFVDNKTNARTIAMPFRLPDGTSAVIMICRLKDETWKPSQEIKNIVINYHEH